MNIVVRNEETKDYRRTEEVAREAFWNLYFPGAAEHYVVHQMRSHTDFIPELAFVIEVDGIVEGAIFYTHSNGVSITTPPRGHKNISRPVVVWRPLSPIGITVKRKRLAWKKWICCILRCTRSGRKGYSEF